MKKSILIVTAACLALSAQAQQRSEKEMQAIAAEHLYGQMGKPSGTTTARPEKLMQNDMVAVYGDRYNGTVFVSRDAIFAPVLGYTDRPLQMEAMPDGLQWWMQTISETMKQKKADNDQNTIFKAEATEVAPLLTTKWAQDTPFNDKCPVADTWTKRRAQTGCVATAMAQVMNYHEYPAKGDGTGYYTLNGGSKKNVRINNTYDWANMKDKYSSTAEKDETTDAVSTLMYDCGLASHMNYMLQASGTTSPVAAAGMVNHFAYDSLALHCSYRVLDNNERWLQTIYDELRAKRPIMYMSTDDTNGAHCFVLDGCRAEDGYLHVNWGWNGDADGYFDFYNLNPKTTMQEAYGMGGYDFSTNAASQSMLTGIMAPDGKDKPYESYWAMSDEETISIDNDIITVSMPLLINYHYLPFYGLVGLCIQDVATGHAPIQPFYYTAWPDYVPVESLAGWENLEIPYNKEVSDNLADGEYDLFLMSWNMSDIGKYTPQYVRFPDKNDGNENYNVWRMVKKDGHLVSIQKTKVPFVMEETPTAINQPSTPITHHPSSIYDLQGRMIYRGYEGTKVRGYENQRSAPTGKANSDEGNLAPSHPRTPAPSMKKGVVIINGKKFINQ